MTELCAGLLIGGGKYRLERLIGEGGMGVVWLATQTTTNDPVAVKFLTASAAVRGEFRQRFRREARATAAVKHPNVVQVREALDSEGDFPALVMEYLVGETLAEVIAREGALPLDHTASLLLPVVSAVGTAHAAGIVHRDLKPENIFLVRNGGGGVQPKVLDFGLAKLLGADADFAKQGGGSTKTGAILGTPFYMSPEQASGERGIDAKADVWALGVILYECLAGRVPITGENFGQFFKNLISGKVQPIAELRPDLPAEVCDVIGGALQHDREARIVDLHAIDAVLRSYTSVQSLRFEAGRIPVGSVPDLSTSSVMLEPTERMEVDPSQVSSTRSQTLRLDSERALPSKGAAPAARSAPGRAPSHSERSDVPPAPPLSMLRPDRSRRPTLAVVTVGALVCAVAIGAVAIRSSSNSAMNKTSVPPEPRPSATLDLAASQETVAPLPPQLDASPASTTEPRSSPVASVSAPTAPPKRPRPSASAPPTTSTTASAAPTMLQGGVAKDVPF